MPASFRSPSSRRSSGTCRPSCASPARSRPTSRPMSRRRSPDRCSRRSSTLATRSKPTSRCCCSTTVMHVSGWTRRGHRSSAPRRTRNTRKPTPVAAVNCLKRASPPRASTNGWLTQDTGAAAAVAQARAQLASAQKAVDDTTVRAPFAGHVTARPVAAGEYVTPASKVATIVRIQPIKLELLVKEADAVKVRRGLPVQAEVSGYPGRALRRFRLGAECGDRSEFARDDDRGDVSECRCAGHARDVRHARRSDCPPPRRRCSCRAEAVLKIANADAIYVIEGNRAQLRDRAARRSAGRD